MNNNDSNFTLQNFCNRFSEAAENYDSNARIQKQVSNNLWDWLQTHLEKPFEPAATIDVGSGTGFMTQLLLNQYACPVHAIDIAPGMVEWLRNHIPSEQLHTHLLDGEHLSIEQLWVPNNCLLVSNMCAQWFSDLDQAIRRWLSVSNTIAFSVLLNGSFEAWNQAHTETGQTAGIRSLPEASALQVILNNLQQEGLIKNLQFKSREFLDQHFDGLSFARSLRAIGADTPKTNHHPVNLRAVIRELGKGCTINYRIGFVFLQR